MNVEIEFPLEFIVSGIPVSHQAKRVDSKAEWRERVKAAIRVTLPENHFATGDSMSVTLFHFSETEMKGDIDNIIKPVLDALGGFVYLDDKQVERVLAQKFERKHVSDFHAPSPVLKSAIDLAKPLTYIRLSNDPSEGLRHGFLF